MVTTGGRSPELWSFTRSDFWVRQLHKSVELGQFVEEQIAYYTFPPYLGISAQLGSRALRADAVEAVACGWLSFVVVLGLLTQLAIGAWWVASLTSLAILWLLIKEGREAWAGEECCGHDLA